MMYVGISDAEPLIQEPSTETAATGAPDHGDDGRQLLHMAQRALESRKRTMVLFPKNIFRDSAWDMMLEMFIAAERRERLCVKDIIILSGESSTSAMRRIDQLQQADFITRICDRLDQRRVWVDLTVKGHRSMATMLQHLFDAGEAPAVGAKNSFVPDNQGLANCNIDRADDDLAKPS